MTVETNLEAFLINEHLIKKTADLAHLELSPAEIKLYSGQLTAVLDYISQLSQVETTGVEPLITATDMPETLREDRVEKLFTADQIVQNAPDKSGHLFKVPPVL
jgi:aspartyl-tRNA(Asn)/glutamyl-tRNA(Gln) amidotransferase subunit C